MAADDGEQESATSTAHGMLDDGEYASLGRISHAMLHYGELAERTLSTWRLQYDSVPTRHQALLPQVPENIERCRAAARQNATVLRSIVHAAQADGSIGPALAAANEHHRRSRGRVTAVDASKVRYVLKDLARDWSAEGAGERAESYGWLLAALERHLPPHAAGSEREGPHVLVPGCGLARLPVELAARGYRAVGNEFSFYMLLVSSWVLNGLPAADAVTIHPWSLTTSNVRTMDDQARAVRVPDVPAVALAGQGGARGGGLGMVTGDFVDVFADAEYAGAFDAVAACFFIDTAHNVAEYLEVIHSVLKPAGLFFNCGPLLYHWADGNLDAAPTELSLELPLADVRALAERIGFEMVEAGEGDARYLADSRALYQTRYTCARWVMRKTA